MSSRKPDYVLLSTIAIMVVFGLIMVSSASIDMSQDRFQVNYHYLKNQLLRGLLPGLILGSIAYLLPLKFWRACALPLLIATIAGLLLVFVPGIGVDYGGARRWIEIGPIMVQPSEFLKLSFIVYLAAWLSAKGKAIKDFSEGLLPFLVAVGLIAILILLEPDIGTLGVIGLTSVLIFFLAGARLLHIGFISIGAAGLLWLLTKVFSHASKRIQVFLNPSLDPQGMGYQIKQALVALGSGGLLGKGLVQGVQKFKYLPEPASDSIAAVIGEELGFIGLMAVVALFIIFAARGFKIAQNAPNDFSRLLAAGITGWLVIQAFINIGAISGLLPLTGITLPFFSLGGTSLAITLAASGLLLNISKYSIK